MTRLGQRHWILVVFAIPLVVAGCGGGDAKLHGRPAIPDGPSPATDGNGSPRVDASPDLAPITRTDGQVVADGQIAVFDVAADSALAATDAGPVVTPDAAIDNAPAAKDTGPAVTPDAAVDDRSASADTPSVTSDVTARDAPAKTDEVSLAMLDAPVDDVSALETGREAVGDGGDESPGLKPRVLIIDPATDQFLAYDHNGQAVHDYRQPFAMGDGYDGRSVWAESPFAVQSMVAGSYYDSSLESALVSAPSGLDEPLQYSRMVVRAKSTLGLGTRVKVVGTDGTVTVDLNLAGDWTEVRLSPSQKFLYAAQHGENATYYCPGFLDTKVMVVRIADGTTLWQGSVCTAAFARDDSHFVFSPASCANPVGIVNLADGKVTQAPSPFPCPSGTGPATLQGATTRGAVFLNDAWSSTSGYRLWFVDWQGKISPFNPAPTPANMEYFLKFNPQGSAALWNSPTSEFDFTTLTNHAWSGFDEDCYGRPDASFAKTAGQSLQYCRCTDGTCASIATLPLLENGWGINLELSPDRRFIFITHGWGLNRTPTTAPEALLYRYTGELLASLPGTDSAYVMFDQTGQLAVLRSRPWKSTTASMSILNLSNGQTTDLSLPQNYGIVYE